MPQHYATVASKHAPHNEANMRLRRDSAQSVPPRFKMPNHGEMRGVKETIRSIRRGFR